MNVTQAIERVKKEFPFPEIYNTARYENIVSQIVKYLPSNSSILDLGAGPCEIPAILSQLGYNCTAYDDFADEWLSKNDNKQKVFDFAKKMSVDIVIANPSEKMPFEKGTFDMFMMHDVLEHLHDSPRDLLNDALETTTDDGILYITVPSVVNLRKRISVLMGRTNLPDYETFYWYPGAWRGPIREYTRGDLQSMCKYLNLNVIKLESCHHMLARVPEHLLSIYKFITTVFPDWKDTWLLLAKKNPDWKPLRNISDKEFNQIMERTQWEQRKKEKLF